MDIDVISTLVTNLTFVNVAAFLLSAALEWFPGVAALWHPLPEKSKRLCVVALNVTVAVGFFLLSCLTPIVLVQCGVDGVWEALLVIAASISTGFGTLKGTHSVLKNTQADKK